MQMRVIRVISYEGNPDWIEETLMRSVLNKRLQTVFSPHGTVRELQRVVLRDGERMRVIVERDEDAEGTPG